MVKGFGLLGGFFQDFGIGFFKRQVQQNLILFKFTP
jgi:hypothetical protein